MLNSSLLTHNQLQSFGIIIDDCPLHLAPDPSHATHPIYSPHDEFCIPLQLKGVISYFTSRCPTTIELECCRWIELTSTSDWDLNAEKFQENEEWVIHGFSDTDHQRNNHTIGALETIVSPALFPTISPKRLLASFKLELFFWMKMTVWMHVSTSWNPRRNALRRKISLWKPWLI
jgi:hypothetical protein